MIVNLFEVRMQSVSIVAVASRRTADWNYFISSWILLQRVFLSGPANHHDSSEIGTWLSHYCSIVCSQAKLTIPKYYLWKFSRRFELVSFWKNSQEKVCLFWSSREYSSKTLWNRCLEVKCFKPAGLGQTVANVQSQYIEMELQIMNSKVNEHHLNERGVI